MEGAAFADSALTAGMFAQALARHLRIPGIVLLPEIEDRLRRAGWEHEVEASPEGLRAGAELA